MGSSLFGLIPAAGSGARFAAGSNGDGAMPKQYRPLQSRAGAGRPMILHSIEALLAAPEIELVFVVLAPDDSVFRTLELGPNANRVAPLYCGGASRRDSVLNGLVAASSTVEPDDWVLVHDAARPCLAPRELRFLIDAVRADASGRGGLLALPVADTLKRGRAEGDAQRVDATVPRSGLWQAQTPQMFSHGMLLDALRGDPGATDESSAVERLGISPQLVEGSSRNIKVTYGPDLDLAALVLQSEGRA